MAQQTEYCRGIPEADRKRPGGETSPLSIRFYCPGCGQKLRAGSDGEKGRCPKCKLRVMAPDWPEECDVYTLDQRTGKLVPTPWWELPPEPDGQVGLNGFRFGGKVYVGFSSFQMRLLDCLHRHYQRGVTTEDASEYVYGKDCDKSGESLISLKNRLNDKLRRCKCPLEVHEVNTGLVLDIRH
jgi:hypothetical protein